MEIEKKFQRLAILYICRMDGDLSEEANEILDNLKIDDQIETFIPFYTVQEFPDIGIDLLIKHTNNITPRFLYGCELEDDVVLNNFAMKVNELNLYGFPNRNTKIQALSADEMFKLVKINNNVTETQFMKDFEKNKPEYKVIYFDALEYPSIQQFLNTKDVTVLTPILRNFHKFIKSYFEIKKITGLYPDISPEYVVFDGNDIYWNHVKFTETHEFSYISIFLELINDNETLHYNNLLTEEIENGLKMKN